MRQGGMLVVVTVNVVRVMMLVLLLMLMLVRCLERIFGQGEGVRWFLRCSIMRTITEEMEGGKRWVSGIVVILVNPTFMQSLGSSRRKRVVCTFERSGKR